MKRFLVRVLLFILILVVGLCGANYLFCDNTTSYTRIMMHEMYNSDNIDIVFVGTSHVYRGIDPKITDGVFGRNTFNAGTSSQFMDGSYYILNEIAKTNQVETVYLDIYFGVTNRKSSGYATYIISDYMKFSLDKYEFVINSGGVYALFNTFFPFRHLMSTNPIDTVAKKSTEAYRQYQYDYVTFENEEYRGKGFVYSNEVVQKNTFEPSSADMMNEYARDYLDQIVELCEKNNINLVLVTLLMMPEYIQSIDNYDEYETSIEDYATEHELKYYDFNSQYSSVLDLKDEYFKDADHMNGEGAEYFTRVFAEFMKQEGCE